MLLVLALAALIWFGGRVMGAPQRLRAMCVGALLLAVVLAQLVLPDGNALRAATGGSAAPWLMLAGAGVLVALYRAGLGRLRARATEQESAAAPSPGATGPFAAGELDRYARHVVLRELGGPGQRALKQASVLVIGAGGLGAPALQYLAAAGVGRIGVIDDDVVDPGNLQRQVIHVDAHIGMPKVFSAQKAMEAQNPYAEIRPYNRRLTEEIAADLFAEYDVILDGTDNFETRYLTNRVAVAQGKPLVSGALAQWEGQVSVFDPAHDAPCYQCIFPEPPADGLAPTCAEAGVLGPLPGVVGSMMAVETIKLIADVGQVLRGEMIIYDALWGETRKITLRRRQDCPVCGAA
ncbi:HesA/MoeB/ThiF family protein [Pseudoponticoccus marisrubri]|uniref:Molybdopterin-synthase adenylyltransferase n=1 Tax=Pseudoponticoccus marisrubri TaxID=1685382 RepID=A0A0W7WPW0_9RHOB|nr:HesA/MoeB/ThiF family protein [Pseudoponticoccus marisrubri]KUF12588.1 molybdopterin biosynthesis protein [Pseudoponticoccus marisrubri]